MVVVVVVGIVVVVIVIIVVVVARPVLLFGPLLRAGLPLRRLLLRRHRLDLLRQHRHRVRQREDAVLDHRIVAGKVHVLQRLDRRQRGAILELDEAPESRGSGLDPGQLFAPTVADELLAVNLRAKREKNQRLFTITLSKRKIIHLTFAGC